MKTTSRVCPDCGHENTASADMCTNCGHDFLAALAPEKTPRFSLYRQKVKEEEDPSIPPHWVGVGLLVVLSLILLGFGFFSSSLSAVQQTSVFAAAAVFGILARIVQAAGHHRQLVRELRRR